MNLPPETIRDNVCRLREGIREVLDRCGRSGDDPMLVAVSKGHAAASLRAAYDAGVRDFGESFAQEFAPKHDALGGLVEARYHFIGTLQSNKARFVVGRAEWVHTLDRPKIVRLMSDLAMRTGHRIKILFEVHLSPEQAKGGCLPEELPELIELAVDSPGIDPVGLMTMPPHTDEPEGARPYFERLRSLRDRYCDEFDLPGFVHLSMGMTWDWRVALEEGATILRIGTAIFGPR